MFPLDIHNYIEILAFLTSAASYDKLKSGYLRWFIPFLFFIVLIELTGRYFRTVLHEPNAWIYNISTTIEFLFYGSIFYQTYQNSRYKSIVKWFLFLYPVAAALNILFIQGYQYFHTYTMSLGALCMVIFACLYFIDLLNAGKKLDLVRTPMFWIASGLLFFYLGNFVYELLFDIIELKQYDFERRLFRAINNSLILVLYSCFIIGFLCQRKKFR
jgi:ABC-type multidrug transport system fused ATPase/permease subunit